MLLILDNYDSFVFNVARYCEELGRPGEVVRNDSVSVADIAAMKPSAIIVSPGPCSPVEAGVSLPVIHAFSGKVPILGVCLGHQCIGAAFGAQIDRAQVPMHGRTSAIRHTGQNLFRGLPEPLTVGRYHSLVVTPTADMEDFLAIDAVSPENEIMALSHRSHPTYGVQFHPESVLSEHGHALMRNFFDIAERWDDGDLA